MTDLVPTSSAAISVHKQPTINLFQSLNRKIFVGGRAAYRWLFISVSGKNYLQKKFDYNSDDFSGLGILVTSPVLVPAYFIVGAYTLYQDNDIGLMIKRFFFGKFEE